jgi:hypothetical protein
MIPPSSPAFARTLIEIDDHPKVAAGGCHSAERLGGDHSQISATSPPNEVGQEMASGSPMLEALNGDPCRKGSALVRQRRLPEIMG